VGKKRSAQKKAAAAPPAPTAAPTRKRYATPLLPAGGALAVVVIALFFWLRAPAFTLRADANRNILLVTIDTLRADALGAYGGHATTPNLDALAAHGARFTFAHAHAVVTLPSHASILSGRYPYEHGIRDNTGYRFPASVPTAATLLKAQGFATGAFIGGFPLDRRFGLNTGFDVYDDRLTTAADDAGERERRADAVVTSALDWIGRQSGKWFAWVHVYDPHATYAAPAEWASRFPTDPYLAEVSWTDSAMGALFNRLAAQARPTLVIATADHGEGLGDHGELTHSVFAYETTLRVPLIIAEAGGRLAGARGVTIDSPARHVDLLPTVLESTGAPAVQGLPGTSLTSVIARGGGDDRPSYFEAMSTMIARGWAPLRGVLVQREKYIDLPIPELYDLVGDPKEARNDAITRADRARVMLNTLKTFNIAPPGRPRDETPDTRERLRSLGYLGGGSATLREAFTEADDPKRLIQLEQIMEKAMDAFRQGRTDEAIALYRDVISRRADTEDAYRKLALVYWRTGNARGAITTLEDALRKGVTQSEVKIKLGQYLTEAGQPGRAIALLGAVPDDDPDALVALGNAYVAANRPADALRAFERLIAVDPGSGLAYQNIGVVQLRAKNFGEAEKSLRHALALDPKLAGAHTALGALLAGTGRRDEAIETWKRAVDADPGELNALYNLTLKLVEAGRGPEARTYGERFLAQAPAAAAQERQDVRRLLDTIKER
jgi:arylsulfatase A-like enzyme/tetratricopeptide (TPR) repeat protein